MENQTWAKPSGGFRGVARGAVAPSFCHLRKYKRMNVLI